MSHYGMKTGTPISFLALDLKQTVTGLYAPESYTIV
jgi:hypothetical protein